uniref:Uncharacterized protein n=1 Tax=Arundo donax TaxID=35708 RepID=A0A0A8ZDF6_ARUDO
MGRKIVNLGKGFTKPRRNWETRREIGEGISREFYEGRLDRRKEGCEGKNTQQTYIHI